MYGNCSCIDSSLYLEESDEFQVKEGRCSAKCELLPVFLIFFFGVTVFTFLASMPALSATLRYQLIVCLFTCIRASRLTLTSCIFYRSVPENQKSFALGVQWLIVRALG